MNHPASGTRREAVPGGLRLGAGGRVERRGRPGRVAAPLIVRPHRRRRGRGPGGRSRGAACSGCRRSGRRWAGIRLFPDRRAVEVALRPAEPLPMLEARDPDLFTRRTGASCPRPPTQTLTTLDTTRDGAARGGRGRPRASPIEIAEGVRRSFPELREYTVLQVSPRPRARAGGRGRYPDPPRAAARPLRLPAQAVGPGRGARGGDGAEGRRLRAPAPRPVRGGVRPAGRGAGADGGGAGEVARQAGEPLQVDVLGGARRLRASPPSPTRSTCGPARAVAPGRASVLAWAGAGRARWARVVRARRRRRAGPVGQHVRVLLAAVAARRGRVPGVRRGPDEGPHDRRVRPGVRGAHDGPSRAWPCTPIRRRSPPR